MSRTTISEPGDARMPNDEQNGNDGDPGQDTGGTRETGGTGGTEETEGVGGVEGAGDADGRREGPRQVLSWIALVVAVGAGALLSVGAFLGVYVRPTSDDWCALWKARDMGVLGITSDFYRTQNGRVTNAFLTGLLYSDDMRGPKLLPAFLILTLGTGLFLLARTALRASGRSAEPPTVPLVAATALVTALLFFAGTRSYQVLLWAPATISHTLPSVIGVWTVLGAVRAARSGVRWARAAAVGAALLVGVALGMLGEPFALVAGVFSATVGVLCLPRFGWTRDRYVSTWCAAACLGLLTGLVLLYTSPGARWRRAQHPPEPLSAASVGETFRDWWRLWQAIGGQWAYLGALAVGVLLGLALSARQESGSRQENGSRQKSGARQESDIAHRDAPMPPSLPPRALFRVAVLLPPPLIGLASLGVVFGLRSGYGDTGWTYGRTWTSFLLPLLIALCAYGAWGGRLLGRHLSVTRRPAGRAAVLVAVGTVAVGSTAALVQPVHALTTSTVVRSVAWDRQNARIRGEVAAGAREVVYRPLLIGGLTEPLFASSYERDWAAQCTATYYGVHRIHRP
ncbi:hypothetical protein EDD98_1286 [Streptomyces sp. PanSC19]|uniref:hypothetical protein n=1 Tax=Streptomyces sp. PanSC19 TaxID=1520455 RepID=UPI000FB3A475|nr:hypothetical protein [Streptomyces sp. PanSC19]ROQ32305.1 hypothetical protein EDD98_1286 [Streptomyces sp. PanSC19]